MKGALLGGATLTLAGIAKAPSPPPTEARVRTDRDGLVRLTPDRGQTTRETLGPRLGQRRSYPYRWNNQRARWAGA